MKIGTSPLPAFGRVNLKEGTDELKLAQQVRAIAKTPPSQAGQDATVRVAWTDSGKTLTLQVLDANGDRHTVAERAAYNTIRSRYHSATGEPTPFENIKWNESNLSAS